MGADIAPPQMHCWETTLLSVSHNFGILSDNLKILLLNAESVFMP